MNATNAKPATKKIAIKCQQCEGTGRIPFFANIDNGICYSCRGAGKTWTTAACIERAKANEAFWADREAAERAQEEERESAYFAARAQIESNGIEGARAFFRAHRSAYNALCGLIAAMRELGYGDAANRVCDVANAL